MRIVVYPNNDVLVHSYSLFHRNNLLKIFGIKEKRYGNANDSDIFYTAKTITHEGLIIAKGTEVEVFNTNEFPTKRRKKKSKK